MRKHWLLFTQTVTIGLALLFVVSTLKPELLSNTESGVVTIYQNTPSDNRTTGSSFSSAAQRAMPAVVNIYTRSITANPDSRLRNDPFFRFFFGDRLRNQPRYDSSLGSGVIVSQDGYILTNHHVIASAHQIEVALSDGRKAKAMVIGSDPETDLAVIKASFDQPLPAIAFGNPDHMQVGDQVLAIGNPFGVGQTVTMGIISALKRDQPELSNFESFIQTDAAINPGNSGGALVDTLGNLIGINTAIYSSNGGSLGIGFAIPANTAKQTMESIIQHGEVTRGWIGTGIQELTPELAHSFMLPDTEGVIITDVIRNSPAQQAGIRPGDILLSINQQSIRDWNDMLATVTALPPGKEVEAVIVRKKQAIQLSIRIGKRPPLRTQ